MRTNRHFISLRSFARPDVKLTGKTIMVAKPHPEDVPVKKTKKKKYLPLFG